MSFELCLSFDDVLIKPTYSAERSRSGVDTGVMLGGLRLEVPLISSPMDTVTESTMAIELGRLGGMGVIHRFFKDDTDRMAEIDKVVQAKRDGEEYIPLCFAIGVSDYEFSFLSEVMNSYRSDYVDMICIDVANGFSILMKEMVERVKAAYPDLKIMAGNIACGEGYEFMADIGVDAVRIGIGGGCLGGDTRILMASGEYKDIRSVKPGDMVFNKHGLPVRVAALINSGFKKVLKVKNTLYDEPIYMTPDHKVLVNEGDDASWLEVSKIEDDSVLIPSYYSPDEPIESIHNLKPDEYIRGSLEILEEMEDVIETFDIEVECPTHSFIASGMIVHNSICKTRIQTGVGIPTLHSVLEANKMRDHLNAAGHLNLPDIIADGGIKYPSDLAKSMIAGASAVICGGIFAGTKESPGDVIMNDEGAAMKSYRGAASEEIQVEKRGGLKKGTVAEGVATLIPYKGSLQRVVNEFAGGLKSSMTYLNAKTTDQYIGRVNRLKRVTENGVKESHAYGTRKR